MKKIIFVILLLSMGVLVSACSNQISKSKQSEEPIVKFAGYVSRVSGCYDGREGYCGEKEGCGAEFSGYIENKGNIIAKDVKVICDGSPDIEKQVGDINVGQKVDVNWHFNQKCLYGNYPTPFDRCFLECSNCGDKRYFSPSRSQSIT